MQFLADSSVPVLQHPIFTQRYFNSSIHSVSYQANANIYIFQNIKTSIDQSKARNFMYSIIIGIDETSKWILNNWNFDSINLLVQHQKFKNYIKVNLFQIKTKLKICENGKLPRNKTKGNIKLELLFVSSSKLCFYFFEWIMNVIKLLHGYIN